MTRSIITRGNVTKKFSHAHIIVLKKTGKAIISKDESKVLTTSKKIVKMNRDEFIKQIGNLNQPVDVDSIDFRIQSVTKSGYAVILAYKDARYDMNMLDKVIGPENWARDHKIIDGRLYCGIGVRIPAEYTQGNLTSPAEWVWKWDVGTESQTEAEKGQASDSFKRSGFNWGIGRELYDFPFICIQLGAGEFGTKKIKQNGYEKEIGYVTKFRVKSLTWKIERDDKGKISSLQAFAGKTKRFDYSATIKEAAKKETAKATTAKETPPKETAPKATATKPATEDKKEAPFVDTAVQAAINKVNMCTTEAELTKYWTKDFREFQKIPLFKQAVIAMTKAVKGK